MHTTPSDLASAVAPSTLAQLSNDALERAVADLSAQLDAAEHRLLTLIREMHRRERHLAHGLASMAHWLGWRVGLGRVAAREKVRVALALGELPHIDAALAAGTVSYSKVRAMTRIATPANEEKLLYMATQATAAQLARICRGVEQVTGSSPEGRTRWLRVVPDRDGMVRLEARLHADEAAAIMKAVALVQDASAEADGPTALVQVAESFIARDAPAEARSGGDRHQLIVCVREDALVPGGVAADISPTGVAVPPDTLRRLACDASMTTVVVDEDDVPVAIGKKTRTIPPAIRRALHVRDGGCRFPGCTHQRHLDAHHIEHWADGGPTTRDNLVLLCGLHHRLVHEGGFRVERLDGALAFFAPDGERLPELAPTVRGPIAELPFVRAPRAPCSGPPNYHWAIGGLVPQRVDMPGRA